LASFAKLLKSFATQVGKNPGDIITWKNVCAAHELLGPIVPTPMRPHRLGRAGKLKSYADHLRKIVPKFEATRQLTKNAGNPKPLRALVRQMHRANLSAGRIL